MTFNVLDQLNFIIRFNFPNNVKLANFELYLNHLNGRPDTGYAITQLTDLLQRIHSHSPCELCIIQIHEGERLANLAGIITNNIIHTIDPTILNTFCSTFLNT